MQRSGSESCDESIRRLIKRAARAIFSDGALEPSSDKFSVSLPVTNASLPEYYRLERFADREDYHSRLQIYSNVNAIQADWDVGAGDMGQLSRITLIDPCAAANILCEELPWDVAYRAIQSIKCVAREGLPSIDCIVEAWSHGKASAGITAERANQMVDSLRVIDAAQKFTKNGQDVLLRRLSARLFKDSKRIEALSRQIAFLIGAPAEDNDVFSRLGLVKHPQPMLLSGPLDCGVLVNGKVIPLAFPYLGFRPDVIEQLVVPERKIRRLLTIENLASFNEAAEDHEKSRDLLIVYIAGSPTPSFLSAYNRILRYVKPIEVMHWGDIDVGGFRIAARLSDSIESEGYKLHLWKMNPSEFAICQNFPDSEKKVEEVLAICEKHGWISEAEGLRQTPLFQEQEFIDWESP